MRVRYLNQLRGAVVLGGVFLLLGLFSGVATADRFLGFADDGDGDCEKTTTDMGQYYGAPTTGVDFDIFLEGTEMYFSIGCTYCVFDSSLVDNMDFTYTTPEAWTGSPIRSVALSEGNVSQQIMDLAVTYPRMKCWLVQATDFTSTAPLSVPTVFGTASYDVAQDGTIQFIIDAPYCGYYTTGALNGAYAVSEVCGNLVATRQESWGSIKKLFR